MASDADGMSEPERKRRLDMAYRMVLGYSERLDENQRLVRDDMERQIRNQAFRKDDKYNTHAAAVRDGIRLTFKDMIDRANVDPYDTPKSRQAIGTK